MFKGLYIHIPFCATKCGYCDFYSLPFSKSFAKRYAFAVANQIKGFEKSVFDSIYFGGGTPSLLSTSDFFEILDAVYKSHTVTKNCEITAETNPGFLSADKLKKLKSFGLNRVSVGVQSTDDKTLSLITRKHNAKKAIETIELIDKIGIQNISADIMLGIKGQTKQTVKQTIDDIAAVPTKHISAYIMKLSEQSSFFDNKEKYLLNHDQQADLYEYATHCIASKGFAQYEISNFCKNGFQSRHNLKYWNMQPYFGAGSFAASCIDDKRYTTNLTALEFCENFKCSKSSFDGVYTPEGEVGLDDFIMLGLRTSSGLDLDKLNKKFKFTLSKQQVDFLSLCERENLLTTKNNRVVLTPKGFLVSNAIISKLI